MGCENVSNGASNWGFTYDQLGRVTLATTPQGNLNYAYNANSLVTQMASPNYGTVNYAYDTLDRPSTITKDGKTFTYSYDALNRKTKFARPNGVETLYAYDPNSRLATLTHKSPEMVGENAEKILEQQQYSYDPVGNITKLIKSRGKLKNEVLTKNIVFELEHRYGYDALNRLTSSQSIGMLPFASEFASAATKKQAAQYLESARTAMNPAQAETYIRQAEALGAYVPETASWTFDANGNIQSKTTRKTGGATETKTLGYDDADRLVSVTKPSGNVTLNYDANGNLTSDSTGRTFTWDAQDQLTKLQIPGQTYTMTYDPLGRRQSQTLSKKTQYLLYDGNGLRFLAPHLDQIRRIS